MTDYGSWGLFPEATHRVVTPSDRFSLANRIKETETSVLPYGLGRSYGDVCLNNGASVISSEFLDHLISFDEETGVVRCEAGVSLATLLTLYVPKGYFLPVSPGTQFVTVGGAIANDVHGKNHHKAGTFGCFVNRLALQRSDGSILECSPDENEGYFRATIGGMGLTGFILWADVQLRPIKNECIDIEEIQFENLEEFFRISQESQEYEYTMAWLDCVSRGNQFGRGIFIRGDHNQTRAPGSVSRGGLPLSVPFSFPSFVLNRYSVKAFNEAFYRKQGKKVKSFIGHYEPFFYPLDSVHHWNRIYGKKGFLQFQCVIPPERRIEVTTQLLNYVVEDGDASFLAVLKEFGSIESPGMMSFPCPGVTLCMDFPYRGGATRWLMQSLEDMVAEAGGRLYSAKDACMTAEHYQQFYPQWESFATYIDPKFSSSFWRRVTGELS